MPRPRAGLLLIVSAGIAAVTASAAAPQPVVRKAGEVQLTLKANEPLQYCREARFDWRSMQSWVEPWVAANELDVLLLDLDRRVRVTVSDAPDGSLGHWVYLLVNALMRAEEPAQPAPVCVLRRTAFQCNITVSPWARTCLLLDSESHDAEISVWPVRQTHMGLLMAAAGLAVLWWGPPVARSQPFVYAMGSTLFTVSVGAVLLVLLLRGWRGRLGTAVLGIVALCTSIISALALAWGSVRQLVEAHMPAVGAAVALVALVGLGATHLLLRSLGDRMRLALQDVLAGGAHVAAVLLLYHCTTSLLAGLISLLLLPLSPPLLRALGGALWRTIRGDVVVRPSPRPQAHRAQKGLLTEAQYETQGRVATIQSLQKLRKVWRVADMGLLSRLRQRSAARVLQFLRTGQDVPVTVLHQHQHQLDGPVADAVPAHILTGVQECSEGEIDDTAW